MLSKLKQWQMRIASIEGIDSKVYCSLTRQNTENAGW